MKYLKQIGSICMFLFSVIIANAQIEEFKTPNVILPEAAALMKYIDYPVTLNTRLVDITIPLYMVKIGELTLPITLSYHTGGIKVNELDGPIALGWTLSAEPSVSRNVNGLNDEYPSLGYYSFRKENLGSNPDPYNSYFFYDKRVAGRYDTEPDDFYYKLADKSGKFFIKKTNPLEYQSNPPFVPVPWEPIQIKQSNNFQVFSIKDENGINYTFGDTSASSYGFYMADGINKIKAHWKAKKMELGKDVINFNYEIKQFGQIGETQQGLTECFTIEDRQGGESFRTEYNGRKVGFFFPFVGEISRNGEKFYETTTSGNNVSKVTGISPIHSNIYSISVFRPTNYESRLYTIDTQLEEIIFDTNAKGEYTTIKVFNKSTKTITRTIKFYTESYKSYSWINRKKLTKVEILDENNVVAEEYRFDYNGAPPEVNSKGLDHWGYYNGGNPQTGIPAQTLVVNISETTPRTGYMSVGHANRSADRESMKQGIIKSITYPTGRKTEFEFEAHQYAIGKFAGGLRIAKITEMDGSEKKIIKTFKYGENELGYGTIKREVQATDYI